jgi:hypothetical protein
MDLRKMKYRDGMRQTARGVGTGTIDCFFGAIYYIVFVEVVLSDAVPSCD